MKRNEIRRIIQEEIENILCEIYPPFIEKKKKEYRIRMDKLKKRTKMEMDKWGIK